MKRPKRRAIPVRIKIVVLMAQAYKCALCHFRDVNVRKRGTNFDHEPALRLRDLTEDGSEYVPHQHDPKYLQALCKVCHDIKTRGSGATTAGTDVGKIKKERRRDKALAKIMSGVATGVEESALHAFAAMTTGSVKFKYKNPIYHVEVAGYKPPRRWPPKGSRPMQSKRKL